MERYVCIHGHFYQPPRENPWLEHVELQDSAYPFHDWNERVTAECYAPNAVARILDGAGRILRLVNNYASISFNFGPTLLSWLEQEEKDVYRLVLEADRQSQERFSGHGSALAQVYNHVIMPLANWADKVTQVRWGIRDFEKRFGRRPEGMWLAETAVDNETLEVLAEEGIRFTILAPHQAARVRPVRAGAQQAAAARSEDQEWTDVTGGKIDPRRAYVQKLPSDRSIALFFYDGPASRAVAFEGLLRKGENLAQRLLSVFNSEEQPQLVHIATDGESYGHHATHGDMALAYALLWIESSEQARLTNYGEFLEKCPPQWEVQIVENTSWSCVHGIERWRSNCGCNSGRPGWSQAWRGPLRAAFDKLRDTIAPKWQEAAGKLFKDPWAARNAYIDVVLDRSPEMLRRFFEGHASRPLNESEQVTARKLLELQRNALLMYTSCGWFFDEISGLESTQVLAYAGRVLHLAEELRIADCGLRIEEPQRNGETTAPAASGSPQSAIRNPRLEEDFLALLEEAPSNLPELGNGRAVYERFIRPLWLDWNRLAAHYAVSSLFESYHRQTSLFCYQAEREDEQLHEAGRVRLKVGRALLTSRTTGDSARFTYGAVHFGDHNVNAGVRAFQDEDTYRAIVEDFAQAFQRVDVPTLVRLMDRHFGEANYSLESLFRDEQRRILKRLLRAHLDDVLGVFHKVYEQNLPFMRFLQHIRAPLPRPYQVTTDLLFNTDLRWAFGDDDPDLDHIRKLVQDANQWGVALASSELSYRFTRMLERCAGRWRQASEQLDPLRALAETVELARSLPFEVNLWTPQNAWFEVGRNGLPAIEEQAQSGSPGARDWLGEYLRLGQVLGIAADDVKKK
jgi:alpha-amylase/alpha-mannosidase (GH57 family)